LAFDPEDGGNMFLQNISCLSMDCTALYVYPRRQNSLLIFSLISGGKVPRLCIKKELLELNI
jgi:hypothetical protein